VCLRVPSFGARTSHGTWCAALTESSELIAGKFWIGSAIEKGALKAF
jgi:hypothetical protein